MCFSDVMQKNLILCICEQGLNPRNRSWDFSPCPSQDRLTRCTMHCNDKAKDLFDSGAKEPAVRSLMDGCVGSCVDDHINLIPSMTRRLKENLDSIKQWGAVRMPEASPPDSLDSDGQVTMRGVGWGCSWPEALRAGKLKDFNSLL